MISRGAKLHYAKLDETACYFGRDETLVPCKYVYLRDFANTPNYVSLNR